MRTRPVPSRFLAAAVGAGALLLGAVGAGAQQPLAPIDEAGWQGVLGVRAPVSAAQRYVVLLKLPSLATRVRAAGGRASDAQMRGWSASAVNLQEQFLARLTASGARITPEYRFTRVVNGFSARFDPTSLALLERDPEVFGVYPVRIAYAAQADVPGGASVSSIAGLSVPGLDGSGVTVALLDTGVDRAHPFLRGNLLAGIDVLTPGSGAVAQPHPTIPGRPERHATELAGIVAGSEGPGGMRGVAPGASILPIRVAGWQPDAEGGYTVYSRTDQLLAGLDVAVDPNEDGDAHDAARIALVGVVEPYASFPDGPLARAVAGATALDTLVVVPAGNDGRAGPAFGNVAGPGGAPEALTVAASDARQATRSVRVHVRAGLRVLFEGRLPLGGAPTRSVTAGVVTVTRAAAGRGVAGLFTEGGISLVAGRAALLPRGALSEETVEEATTAGATAVLVDGLLPAGSFSLDVPIGVPVVGLPDELVREIRTLLAGGIPVTAAVGAVSVSENETRGSVAAFSSRGLAIGGGLKPELVAAGVAIPTSEPGRASDGDVRYGTVSGTSVAAAVAAGAAAVLAEGRPGLTAAGLHGLLVGSAQRTVLEASASGAGLVDLRAAVQQELVADPAAVSFGPTAGGSGDIERLLRVRNVSTRALDVVAESAGLAPKGVQVSLDPARFRLAPGAAREVVVVADTRELSEQAGVATGELVLRVAGSPETRVPWAVVVPNREVDLLSRVELRATARRVSDATPAVLSLVAGAVTPEPDTQIRPVDVLEVQLWQDRELLGVLLRRRELLPGRYSFGLTGRRADGERLPRGTFTIRVVARPGDGTRRQVESIEYRVR
ncbi:MAG TPA: S8 family serine peptidase [Gaiellaceae bacterium]|nr:S8 family serine peptidase [Gaiellaceae bacterium]